MQYSGMCVSVQGNTQLPCAPCENLGRCIQGNALQEHEGDTYCMKFSWLEFKKLKFMDKMTSIFDVASCAVANVRATK